MEEKINLTEMIVFFLQNIEGGDPYPILTKICRPTAIYAIERRYLRGFDRSDFWQEAHKVLLESIRTYNFDLEMKFVPYYALRLENHFNRLIRAENAQKRKSTREATSFTALEEETGVYKDEYSTIGTAPDQAIVIEEAMAEYLQDLSKFELDVFFRYISNESYDQIAKELNCTKKKVQSAMHRCSKKLRESFKEN